MKEVTKERKRRRNSKEGFTKMNKDRKMKDGIGSKMVQANPKITEKSMKEGGSREAKSSTDKGGEKNNLTRTWSRDPMLAWSSPFSNVLALDQAIADKLAKLVFSRCWLPRTCSRLSSYPCTSRSKKALGKDETKMVALR